jgi:hypothetical protein
MTKLRVRLGYTGSAKSVGYEDSSARPVAVGDANTDSEALFPESAAKNLIALVEMLVPRIVAETIAELERRRNLLSKALDPSSSTRSPLERSGPPAIAPSDVQMNGRQLAHAVFGGTPNDSRGEWSVYAIKKANRILHAQGKEELIFSGRLSTPAKINAWLTAHPDFAPNRVLCPQRKWTSK